MDNEEFRNGMWYAAGGDITSERDHIAAAAIDVAVDCEPTIHIERVDELGVDEVSGPTPIWINSTPTSRPNWIDDFFKKRINTLWKKYSWEKPGINPMAIINEAYPGREE